MLRKVLLGSSCRNSARFLILKLVGKGGRCEAAQWQRFGTRNQLVKGKLLACECCYLQSIDNAGEMNTEIDTEWTNFNELWAIRWKCGEYRVKLRGSFRFQYLDGKDNVCELMRYVYSFLFLKYSWHVAFKHATDLRGSSSIGRTARESLSKNLARNPCAEQHYPVSKRSHQVFSVMICAVCWRGASSELLRWLFFCIFARNCPFLSGRHNETLAHLVFHAHFRILVSQYECGGSWRTSSVCAGFRV